MTAKLIERNNTVGFATFPDREANCPHCGTTHNITEKMDDAAYKNKRNFTTIKCVCGVRLGVFYCAIGRSYHLESRYRKKEIEADWKANFNKED